jgi:hypothetical protein
MRRRPLDALYLADSISLVGNAVAQLAIPWFVLATAGSALIGGLVVETIGVAGALLAIGLCYLAVTLYGFFNSAFRELDRPDAARVAS